MATFNPLQASNQPASSETVKLWAAKQMRRISDAQTAKRKLRATSKAVNKCNATPGCSPAHHVALAQAIRAVYSMGG